MKSKTLRFKFIKSIMVRLLFCSPLFILGCEAIVSRELEGFHYTPFQGYFVGSFMITTGFVIVYYWTKKKL